MASYGKRYKCSIKCSSNSNFRINTGVLADYAGVRFPPSPPNVKYTNTMSRIRLAVYRNVFALIVEIDGYEGETRLQTKRATYKDIQAWVKERYGIHVSNLAISQTKELCGLAKTKYKGYGDAEGQPAPKLAAKKEAAIREAFIWFGLIEKE